MTKPLNCPGTDLGPDPKSGEVNYFSLMAFDWKLVNYIIGAINGEVLIIRSFSKLGINEHIGSILVSVKSK